MGKEYDFAGWATRNNLKCSDGRTIIKDAFKNDDGKRVPLVWHHQYSSPGNVLGYAILENRDEGVYAYCNFNNTNAGQNAKMLVEHGDISELSIFANNLIEKGASVLHGAIREVSLVLSGANPGAKIETVIQHSDGPMYLGDDEGVITTGEGIVLCHADDKDDKNKKNDQDKNDGAQDKGDPNKDEDQDKNDPKKDEPGKDDPEDDKTIADVYNSMTDEQKNVIDYMVGQIAEEMSKDKKENKNDKGGDKTMKHNVFDQDGNPVESNVLTHADQMAIITSAKSSNVGSLKAALKMYAEEKDLQHDALTGGVVQDGDGNIGYLFPEYKDVTPGAPELVTDDQGWIESVMNKVHKSPMSRIRTRQADVRKIKALQAKGYKKGKQKKLTGNFNLVVRTTDPQTVYVKDALNRDDVVDITDFDYVDYIYNIDKEMLKEELAVAIMIGDGREIGDEDKIMPDKIRPIWTDDDLYAIHVDLDINAAKKELQGTNTEASFGPNYVEAEAMVNTILYAMENYKGTGTPDLYITPHECNVMLLARDLNGRRIYSSKAELATALGVGEIHKVEQFKDRVRKTDESKDKELVCIVANMADYTIGATKGGELTHFTDFDIDFNQLKSLLETRCSGALRRIYSAVVVEKDVTDAEG